MKLGTHHSEETKAKFREARKHKTSMLGKHHSEETKAKIRAKAIGRKHSEATKKKMSGEKHPNWKGDKAKPHSGRMRAQRHYPCPKGMVRHHKDGNPLNNEPENIIFCPRGEHTRNHHLGKHHRINKYVANTV